MPSSKAVVSCTAQQQPQSIHGYTISSLAISPYERDLAFLRTMFADANWTLFTAHTYKEAMTQLRHVRVPVVLCERQLPDRNWKDILSQLAPILRTLRKLFLKQISERVSAGLILDSTWLGAEHSLVAQCHHDPTGDPAAAFESLLFVDVSVRPFVLRFSGLPNHGWNNGFALPHRGEARRWRDGCCL